ncbi:GMC family oxidoreductase [Streptomyces sp. NPDC058256]|uniref:GMC family oxidoreductase n=1 Tax=Streptomyces sp. NPDC058256 TaxID=3346408 RepID=UPI0036EC121F
MRTAATTYDYVIVGAGSAGCVLAARLSEDEDARVLLLEAGGEPPPESTIPAAWPMLLAGETSWPDATVVQPALGVSVPWPHGRAVGGSSAINAMLHLRGHRSGYDAWPAAGAKGWAFDDLLPYFRRTESAPHRDAALRGTSGPLTVSPALTPSPLAVSVLEAAQQAGYARADDVSGGLEEGFGFPDLAIVDGRRLSAADAYLTPARQRPNLRVVTGALVHRVLVRGGRCVGVEYSVGSELVTVACEREVVLSAGAVGTPQVLLRSGIGPASQLSGLGIDPVADLPGVGKNLHDHATVGVTYATPEPVPDSINHSELVGLVRSQPEVAVPNLQIFLISVPMNAPSLPLPECGYSIGVGLMTPHSRGTLRLSSANPSSAPLIDPGYLRDRRDRDALEEGLRITRSIGRSPAMAAWHGEEVLPGPGISDASLGDHLRVGVTTYFHYVGSCRIGTDELAVVDTELRVQGVTGLRAADASVIPAAPTANTQATVLAIAERAAALVKDQRA